MQSLLVLGSTGSIGTQTLELVGESAGGLCVAGLAAHGAWELLAEQCARFRPRFVALGDEAAAERLAPRLPPGTRLLRGPGALEQIARECEYDIAVHGVVGAAGLVASVRVLERGKTLALANKESLVLAGALLMPLAEQHGARIVPVDSEHSAIFQCLRGERLDRVRRVILTASGGPFRNATREELARATPRSGPQASQLEHGAAHHDRLGDPDEQGARGDRAAAPLRPRPRTASRSSSTRSRSCTRWSSSSTVP